jgi:hypothetical protein
MTTKVESLSHEFTRLKDSLNSKKSTNIDEATLRQYVKEEFFTESIDEIN